MEKIVGAGLNIWSKINSKHSIELAFKLFSTPRKGKFTSGLPLFLQSAQRHRIAFEDEEIQCYTWQHKQIDQPVLLLIHGWQSNALRWQELIELLHNDFTIVAIDAMGLGNSSGTSLSVARYTKLIDQVIQRFDPTYIAAHSLGAFALLQALALRQDHSCLQKIVLLGTLDKFEDVLEDFYQLLGLHKSFQQKFSAYLRTMIHCELVDYRSLNSVDFLAKDVQVLAIHDKDDTVVSLESTKDFYRSLLQKGALVQYSKGLGHSVQDPVVYQWIQSFLLTQ